MAVFNSLTFDGENSLDYGVYISGEAVYDAPERAVEMISIPGRNGAIALDQGRFENIDVTYPAGTFGDDQADFAAKIRKFRNLLASRYSYVRLTDSYHPDEFRLGLYKGGLNASPVQYGSAGQFPITFNCKPQRFLTSGETEVDASEWSGVQSESGAIVEIDNSEGEFGLKSLVADIDPIQNLNGYDRPWVGGAGKNKLQTKMTSGTSNGITFTVASDGTFTAQGTATATASRTIGTFFAQSGVRYTANGCPSGGSTGTYRITITGFGYDVGNGYSFTGDGASHNINCDIYPAAGAVNLTIKPMIRLASETDATFAPYENICPISGYDSVVVTRTGKNLLPYPYTDANETRNGVTFTVSPNGTIKISGTATRTTWLRLFGGFASDAEKKSVPSWIAAGKSYTLSGGQSANARLQVDFYNGTTSAGEFVDTGNGATFTPTASLISGSDSFAIFLRIQSGATVDATISPMIRFSSETAEWEPFGSDYTTELGRTVYKGTLDITTGVLTVTHGIKQFTGANQQGVLNDSYFAYDTSESPSDAAGGIYPSVYYCDSYKAVNNANERLNGTFYLINKNVVFVNDAFTSVAEANTLLASQKPTVVYPLATPLTYQLTPQEIELLLGDNNIWANSGDVTIEYGTSPLYNPTEFDAKPLIKVVGTGTLRVGDTTVTITGTAGQTIYIDCETMEIYKLVDGTPQSAASLVSFSGNDFPVLEAGSNTVGLGTGITSVTIIPRWWII